MSEDGAPGGHGAREHLSQCTVVEPVSTGTPTSRGWNGREGCLRGAHWPHANGRPHSGRPSTRAEILGLPSGSGFGFWSEKLLSTLWVTDAILLQVLEFLVRGSCWGTNDTQSGSDLVSSLVRRRFHPTLRRWNPGLAGPGNESSAN